MKLQFRPSKLKVRRTKLRYIIIHHTAEQYSNPATLVDNPKFQTEKIYNGVLELKQGDINYNFLIEKINSDYQIIMARPFPYLCEYPDIPNDINNSSIHIGCMGNYDLKIPDKRFYEVLAYKVINPLMKQYHLTPSLIKLHRDVTTKKDLSCPGYFFNDDKLYANLRRFVIQ